MKEHNLMSSFEINKIMGSVFSIILVLLAIKNLSDALYIEDNTSHHTTKTENNKNIEAKVKLQPDTIILDIEERLKITLILVPRKYKTLNKARLNNMLIKSGLLMLIFLVSLGKSLKK